MDGYAKRRIEMDGYKIDSLDVQGFDAPVPNSFWSIGSDTLLVLLPGLGYTNEMPIMFYLHELAINRRYDVLQVNYDYRGIPRDTSAEAWSARMIGDVQPAIEAALAKGSYQNVILAGKSIGTRVMAALLAHGFDKATAYIWLTPLFMAEPIREIAMKYLPAVAVFGDADYAVKDVDFGKIANAGVYLVIQPGGDHGMMIPGNVPESIADLAKAMHEIDGWLARTITHGVAE